MDWDGARWSRMEQGGWRREEEGGGREEGGGKREEGGGGGRRRMEWDELVGWHRTGRGAWRERGREGIAYHSFLLCLSK
jgi:hypothetical protein